MFSKVISTGKTQSIEDIDYKGRYPVNSEVLIPRSSGDPTFATVHGFNEREFKEDIIVVAWKQNGRPMHKYLPISLVVDLNPRETGFEKSFGLGLIEEKLSLADNKADIKALKKLLKKAKHSKKSVSVLVKDNPRFQSIKSEIRIKIKSEQQTIQAELDRLDDLKRQLTNNITGTSASINRQNQRNLNLNNEFLPLGEEMASIADMIDADTAIDKRYNALQALKNDSETNQITIRDAIIKKGLYSLLPVLDVR
jgi:hypothetical protein